MTDSLRLDQQRLTALRALGTRRRYEPGAALFRESELSDHIAVVLGGMVKVCATSRSGYETVLAVRSTDEIVGELAAFDRRPRSASIIALTVVEAVLVRGSVFRGYLRSDPDLAVEILRSLVERLRESDRRRVEFGACDVTTRVARLLLDLTERHGTTEVALSQLELAGAVGASREAVARSLRLLRTQGAVQTRRLRITVLRPEALQAFTDETPGRRHSW